jgi:hypothetical protein
MKIIINCDNLSPMDIHRLKTVLTDTLRNNALRVKDTIALWNSNGSESYKELRKWEKAAFEEYHSVITQFKEAP